MSEHSSGWSRKFDEPIALADGGKLVTLRDAANYITARPKKESDLAGVARWSDDVGADRRHEGIEPRLRSGV
jgi:hypothetical protein